MSTIERHAVNSAFPVDAEHLHRYAFAAELVQKKVVLDIACGEGYGSNILAKQAEFVTAVDLDQRTVTEASKNYKRANLLFKQGSLLNIPVQPEIFDVVVSFETLEHIVEHDLALVEIKRVLKPNGLLILSTPNKKEYTEKPNYHNPFHEKELYQEEVETLLKKNFKHVQFYAQRFYSGSLIASIANSDPIKIYFGSTKEINVKMPDQEPMFFITLASNIDLPLLGSSIYDLTDSFLQNHRNEVKELYNSKSYRIGNFLVRALSLFTKK